MRIFLDVGAHVGETLEEVIKPQYRFDRIVAFEPSAACIPALEAMAEADPRIEICQAGLSNRTAQVPLYQAGSEAGSVLGVLEGNPDHGTAIEQINLIEAGTWLRDNTNAGDLIVMKTNCEGSEVDIVENLLDSAMLDRLYLLLITWDIRMYPGGLARERALRQRLAKAGATNFCSSDDVMVGPSHGERIANWLGQYGLAAAPAALHEMRQSHAAVFKRNSGKSGRWHRIEHGLKQNLAYENFPRPIKRLLQFGKRISGLSRERRA